MGNLTEFINNELYPALFERVDEVFSQMEFKKSGRGWSSRFNLDLSLPQNRRADKVNITRSYPKYAIENSNSGDRVVDLITLYKRQNNLNTDKEAIEAICGKLSMELPPMENSEQYEAYKAKQEELEASLRRMRKALFTEEGKEALTYLKEKRKYEKAFIDFAEFGYCTNEEAKRLSSIFSSTNSLGEETNYLPYGVGVSHVLAIPYRTGNTLSGFVFRAVEDDTTPKYKDVFTSKTATKKYHLFGLTGLKLTGDKQKDHYITVVEGEIDALRGRFCGIENMVASTGGDVSSEALKEAKDRGVKYVTLLFDTEATDKSQQDTNKKIAKAIEKVFEAGLYPFVASLPSTDGEKCDVDTYLQQHNGMELKSEIDNAKTGAIYLFDRIANDIIERVGGEDEEIGFKELVDFKNKTIELANRSYITPTDRDLIFNRFARVTNSEITKENIQEEADKLKGIEEANLQKEKTLNTIKEAYSLVNSNDEEGTEKALNLLEEKLSSLKSISEDVGFSKLLRLPTIELIKKGFSERPTALNTSFVFSGERAEDERFQLQCGALTYICAPTSHGKSRMLENLALDLCTREDTGEGDVLYFTFEESSEAVKMQFLNMYIGRELSHNNMRSIASYYATNKNYFKDDSIELFKAQEPKFFKLLTSGKLRVISEDYDSKQLVAAIRFMAKNIKVKAVFVDYIQLLHTRGTRLGRKEELADMCRDFMTTAKDTGLPIVLAAQLNREALSPVDMAVQNITEASEIEHSANTIMLLWNSINMPLAKNTYYIQKNKERELTKVAMDLEAKGFKIGEGGKIYAILAKNRGGERNIDAVLDFNGNTGRISQPQKKKEIHDNPY